MGMESHFHKDQRNLPGSIWFTTCFFWLVNNGANTSKLTSANDDPKSHNLLISFPNCLTFFFSVEHNYFFVCV